MTARRHRRSLLAAALVAGLFLAGCGDDGDDGDEATSGSTTTEAASGATGGDDAPGSTDGGGSPSTTDADESATTAPGSGPVDDADLPGEPIDIHPYEGALLAVVGVDADDTLNVRAGPGTSFAVLAELAPLDDGFTATGRNRTLDDGSFWAEVEAEGVTGWANGSYLAQLGSLRDITAEVTVPADAADTEAAALAIARQRAPEGEGPTPTVTVVARASATDVTVDLIGLGDDAAKGERLHVTGSGSDLTVEASALCARGVTADGLCT